MSGDNDKFVNGIGKGHKLPPGKHRFVVRNGALVPISGGCKVRDNAGLQRIGLPWVHGAQAQAQAVERYERAGVHVEFDPESGVPSVGHRGQSAFDADLKIVKCHGLEVG